VRKDVECVFGRVKGRFRTLKIPSRFQDKEKIVNQFKACAVLHNILHDHDFGSVWDMDWTGVDGNWDEDEQLELRKRMQAQIDRHAIRVDTTVTLIDSSFDESGVGVRSAGADQVQVEFEAGWQDLRRKLVIHFTYAYKNKLVKWVGA
jgi:hypothetical protein